MRKNELMPVFVEGGLPERKDMEEGFLYISESRHGSSHLCACGCKEETYLSINHENYTQGWDYTNNNGLVTFRPSVGNFKKDLVEKGQYHAHYLITENKVQWV